MAESPPRRSCRLNCIEPQATLGDSGASVPKEVRLLTTKGGIGGRIRKDNSQKWTYFPQQSKTLEYDTNELQKQSILKGLDDNSECTDDDETEQKNDSAMCTHQLINTRALENTIKETLVCKCALNTTIDDFITYCVSNDNQLEREKLTRLKEQWQKKRNPVRKVHIHIENFGLEPLIYLKCGNCKQENKIENEMTKFVGTSYKGKKMNVENCSWYATNLRVVLGTLASGLGATDSSSLLVHLGLPNLQSFSKQQFTRIELRIGKYLREVAGTSMRESLVAEIEKTKKECTKQTRENETGLTIGYDMGWTKRASGNRYDSVSGHAFFVGCFTKKILMAQITSKKCNICISADKRNVSPPEHVCPRNYEGSSKAMESDAALSMVKKLHTDSQGKVYVRALVTDDDASLRAIVAHPTTRGKGRLPTTIPAPEFLADPSHRTRVVARAIFALAALNQDISECKKLDALRFKRYFGYMLRQARHLELEDMSIKFKAVIEHLFDNHIYCDAQWCRPLRIEQQNDNNLPQGSLCMKIGITIGERNRPPSPVFPTPTEPPQSYYRSKTEHSKLYDQMQRAYAPYTTPERIRESQHPYDTQLNESLNNVVAKFAPKNRTYAHSMSLSNRIAIVIGSHNYGSLRFWSKVYDSLSLPMSSALLNHLMFIDKKKKRKRIHNEKFENKQKRTKKANENIRNMIRKEIEDAKRGATYRTGIGIEDSIPASVREEEIKLRDEGKVKCKLFGCHGTSHRTRVSKQCAYHKCRLPSEIRNLMNMNLRAFYPEHYGE